MAGPRSWRVVARGFDLRSAPPAEHRYRKFIHAVDHSRLQERVSCAHLAFGVEKAGVVTAVEKIRAVSATQTKIEIIVDDAFLEKVERLKSLLSHQAPQSLSFKELVELLIDKALKKPKATPPAAEFRFSVGMLMSW